MFKKLKNFFHRKKEFQRKRLLFGVFFISLPFLFFICDKGFSTFLKYHEQRRVTAISQKFDHELDLTLQKVEQAQSEREIDRYLPTRDTITLSGILYRFVQKYHLWAMAVVDKSGIAIARFPSLRVGDYVFQTSPWGIRVGRGESLVTVVEGNIYPLVIVAGVPFFDEGMVQGALFGGYLLNDAYAFDFQKKYLEENEELAFYGVKSGVFGTTFENEKIKKLLKIYFNEGTDWVQKGKSDAGGQLFQVGDKFFHVGNIPLHGLEEDSGGILVFFEVQHHIPLFIAGVLSIFLFLFLYHSFLKEYSKKKPYVRGFPLVFGLILFSSIFVFEWIHHRTSYRLDTPPYVIYNSTLSLLPEFGLFSLSDEQRIQVQITTGGEPINAAEIILSFDPKIGRVEDVLLVNSFCDKKFILKKNIDNENGEVVLSCLAPEGFTGENAIMAEVIVQPLQPGNFNFVFEKESKVLAHDGLGTNVLRASTNGSYTIIDQESVVNENIVSFFSYSHPNAARWYKNKNIHIEWSGHANIKNFWYRFDMNTDTIPNQGFVTSEKQIDFVVKKDGIYFFHIVPESIQTSSSTSHLKVMIDTTPPENIVIKSSADRVKQGDIVRFQFGGSDSLSGVQSNYYVSMDGGMFLPSLKQLYVPFVAKGEHTLTLRIFDNAGNFRDAKKTVFVE